MLQLTLLLVLLMAGRVVEVHSAATASVTNAWPTGFDAKVELPVTQTLDGWKIHVVFDKPVDSLTGWNEDSTKISDTEFILTNVDYNAHIDSGTTFLVDMQGKISAGDHVKFGFPMAGALTMLLWGVDRFKDGYEAAGQLDKMYDTVKWGLDYLLNAWNPFTQELLLLYNTTHGNQRYRRDVENFLSSWQPGGDKLYKPCGFVLGQLHLLGIRQTRRYEIGYGDKYPLQPHHRAA
nr:hypothetical protein BaRGS_006579 [Batillaria attramentaria]